MDRLVSLFLGVCNLSAAAGCAVPVLLFLRPLFRRAPKWITLLLFLPIGVRLLLPFSLTSDFSLLPTARILPESALSQTVVTLQGGDDLPQAPDGAYRAPFAAAVDALPPERGPYRFYSNTVSLLPENTLKPFFMQTDSSLKRPVELLSLIYVGGTLLFLLYLPISALRLRHRLRTALPTGEKRVYQSDRIRVSFVLGVFSPRIYLPCGLSPREQSLILAHERAHIARGDHLTKLVAYLLLSFHWFNPLLWAAYLLFLRDQEIACDERAVRHFSREERRLYALTLLKSAYRGKLPFLKVPSAASFGGGALRDRIRHVMVGRRTGRIASLLALSASLLALAALSLGFLTFPRENRLYGRYFYMGGSVDATRALLEPTALASSPSDVCFLPGGDVFVGNVSVGNFSVGNRSTGNLSAGNVPDGNARPVASFVYPVMEPWQTYAPAVNPCVTFYENGCYIIRNFHERISTGVYRIENGELCLYDAYVPSFSVSNLTVVPSLAYRFSFGEDSLYLSDGKAHPLTCFSGDGDSRTEIPTGGRFRRVREDAYFAEREEPRHGKSGTASGADFSIENSAAKKAPLWTNTLTE